MAVKPIVFLNGRNWPCFVIPQQEHDALVLYLRTARVGAILTPRNGATILVEFPGMSAAAVSRIAENLK